MPRFANPPPHTHTPKRHLREALPLFHHKDKGSQGPAQPAEAVANLTKSLLWSWPCKAAEQDTSTQTLKGNTGLWP